MTAKTIPFSPDQPFQFGVPHFFAAALVVLVLLWHWAQDEKPVPGFPVVNKEKGDWFNSKAKNRIINESNKIMKEAHKKYNGKPFQIIGELGPTIILPPHMAHEIRNMNGLSFKQATERNFLPWFKGLEPFSAGLADHEVFQSAVRINLTQSLGSITQSLSDETTYALSVILPDINEEWSSITWVPFATKLIARLSAKVFLGESLCRNEEWLNISMQYTIDSFNASRLLRWYPPFLRPLVHFFRPEFKKLQQHIKDSRRIIEPEIAKRKEERRAAIAAGEKPHKAVDAIEWMEEQRKDIDYDISSGQLIMSVAAIHTTAGMISALLWELCANPEYVDDLRKEIVKVIKEDGGWKKTSLYKMRLLDSCMKEAQRLHVTGSTAMGRKVMTPITLSDGTKLPAGAYVAIPTWPMKDSFYYENPQKFDGRRFLEKRNQPGNENRWQFVTTTPEHLGFGHGQHACPGRFFAGNEIKIAMAHILMKYDWKFEGEPPLKSLRDSEWIPDPTAKIMVRKREPEIQF
ncbi:P450 monooxygenase [Macrophomina phaseolina]|uniref:P450 monooxygenase n=1 Tax=Macrophomina phaseolina TaxID=35725 RepID=A0ABQ8FQC8_9PEZI|nr:P450 monooxygenase [Macrophomina phaseolina]